MRQPEPLRVRNTGGSGRPPLLLLHGFLGNGSDWESVIASLSDRLLCLVPDLPGHGGSLIPDLEPGQGMNYTAQALCELLDSVSADPADIIGYSMGGRIALHFALRYPERCRRLILESASPGLSDPAERSARLLHDLALARRLETEPLETFLRDWYRQPLFASLSRSGETIERLIKRRSQADSVQLARALRAFSTGAQEPLWGNLGSAPPSLLIVGDEDAKFRAIAVRMANQMPDATVEIVDRAGHNVHLEQPDRYIQIVRTFLSEEKG